MAKVLKIVNKSKAREKRTARGVTTFHIDSLTEDQARSMGSNVTQFFFENKIQNVLDKATKI